MGIARHLTQTAIRKSNGKNGFLPPATARGC
jgi:hypothetical protein